MQIRTILKSLLAFSLTSSLTHASTISRLTTFVDGQVLFASDLNGELNQLINTINLLDNSNLSSTANIAPSKLSAAIAGAAINRDPVTGILSVNVDGSTIVIAGNALSVVAGGIGPTQLAPNSVTTAAIADGAVTTPKYAAGSVDTTALKDGAVTTSKYAAGSVDSTALGALSVQTGNIADQAVTTAKIAVQAITQNLKEIRPVSAAPGFGGFARSSSTGTFGPTSSTAYVQVTNLSVTLATHGNPVHIAVIPDGTTTPCFIDSTGESALTAQRDLTDVGYFDLSVSGARTLVPCSVIDTYDTPVAGTYVYTIKIKSVAGGANFVSMGPARLIAYEL